MPINPTSRLKHILAETEFLVLSRTKFNTVEELESDEFLKRSTTRSIEIIGEAIKGLPDSIVEQYPEIPWKKIARIRDNLIHRYFGVDYQIVLNVVQNIAPEFNIQISQMLKKLYRDRYLELREQLSGNNIKGPQSYFGKLNQFKKQDIAIAKLIVEQYNLEDLEIAHEEIRNTLIESDYLRVITPESLEKPTTAYLAEIISITSNDSSLVQNDQERE